MFSLLKVWKCKLSSTGWPSSYSTLISWIVAISLSFNSLVSGVSSFFSLCNTKDFKTTGLPDPSDARIFLPSNLICAGFLSAVNRFVILYLSLLTIDTSYIVFLSSNCDKSKIPSLLLMFLVYTSSPSNAHASTNLNSISSVIFLLVFESNISNL